MRVAAGQPSSSLACVVSPARAHSYPFGACEDRMATQKQAAAARRNIKKAARAAKKKRTIARLPKKTRTALGKEGAKAARRKSQR